MCMRVQLLVRVKSAGVNPVDTYIRSGKFSPGRFPYVPGCDGAGVVEEVGKLVTKFKVHKHTNTQTHTICIWVYIGQLF